MKTRNRRVVLRRDLHLTNAIGGRTTVPISFELPRQHQTPACCWLELGEIEGETRPVTIEVEGDDVIDALYLAMQMASTRLVTTKAYQEGRLTFGGIPDLGLPAPPAIRALMHSTVWVHVRSSKIQSLEMYATILRSHVAAVGDDDIAAHLNDLTEMGHNYIPFAKERSALAFISEVSRTGLACGLTDNPWQRAPSELKC